MKTTLLQAINNGFTPDTMVTNVGRVLILATLICIGAYFLSEFNKWKTNDH